jgi:hypothetical protein
VACPFDTRTNSTLPELSRYKNPPLLLLLLCITALRAFTEIQNRQNSWTCVSVSKNIVVAWHGCPGGRPEKHLKPDYGQRFCQGTCKQKLLSPAPCSACGSCYFRISPSPKLVRIQNPTFSVSASLSFFITQPLGILSKEQIDRCMAVCERSVGTVFQLPNPDAIYSRDEGKERRWLPSRVACVRARSTHC